MIISKRFLALSYWICFYMIVFHVNSCGSVKFSAMKTDAVTTTDTKNPEDASEKPTRTNKPTDDTEKTTHTLAPTDVVQGYQFRAIHRGFFMGCGINLDTSVSCWSSYGPFWSSAFGYDGRPPGKTVFRYPAKLPNLTTAVQLASGYDKHCALLANGSVSCWGPNNFGLIPNYSSSSQYLTNPTTLAGITDATHIAVGHGDSCAVLKSGKVNCWGFVVGDGYTDAQASTMYSIKSSPVEIQGLQDMVEIVMGLRLSCGRDTKGQVICWKNFPTRVNAERKVLSLPLKAKGISLSDNLLCIAFEDGSAKCFPKDLSLTFAAPSMGNLSSLKNVRQIVAGMDHACGLQENGRVYCWGNNTFGELENGLFNRSDVPILIEGISDVVQLSSGNTATCALDKSNRAYCWGDDESWGEGVFGRNYAKIPTVWSSQLDIKNLTSWRMYNGCQQENSGAVYCWGWNRFGGLGTLPFEGSAAYKTKVNIPPAKTLVRAPYGLACILSQTDEAWCWGARNFNIRDLQLPFKMPAWDGATALSSGLQHVCALKGGKVSCIGKNFGGQLGNGTTNESISQPVEVVGISSVTAIWSDGGDSSSNCAKAADGVYCWGYDLYAQLPLLKSGSWNTYQANPNPQKVRDWGQPIEFVAVGREIICLADSKGSIRCTGSLPSSGYTGERVSDPPRYQFTYTIQKLQQLSAGAKHVCTLTTDKSVYCWGNNDSGQLGDGTDIDRAMPTKINYPEAIVDIIAQVDCTYAKGVSGRWYFNGRCQNHL